jgi:hypothetical protein
VKRQTVVDQIEITRDGTIGVRCAKEIIDDDGTVLTSQWHRTVLPPGTDIDAQMALVNQHLTGGLKEAAVSASDIARIKTVAPVAWTDEVKTNYAAKVKRVEAAAAAKSADHGSAPG